MNYTSNILDELPLEKRSVILKKMRIFEELLLSNISISGIPKGFWIKRIYGTDIYKFRVNSGDRILFKYINDNKQRKIIFISYCNHDKQIRRGKNIDTHNLKFISDESYLDIDINEYKEDDFDIKIDNYIKAEVYGALQEIKNELVIEDEYIALSIEENNEKDLKFLSIQQYECIENNKNPLLILGCAGSGKTNIGIRKLILNNKFKVRSAYITCSDMIKNKVKCLYNKLEADCDYISFYTLQEICLHILHYKEDNIIEYYDFFNWFNNNNFVRKYKFDFSTIEIWVEINSIIKGKMSSQKIMTFDEYSNVLDSSFDFKNKKKIYKIASLYQSWLNENNYYDANDLAFEAVKKIEENFKYDYIVYDEFQELTEKQIYLVLELSRNKSNIMLMGDINQTLNIDRINFKFINNKLYDNIYKLVYKNINKNYRNSFEVVEWINKLKEIKNSKFISNGKEFEMNDVSVKNGNKPIITYSLKDKDTFFNKADNIINGIVVVADEEDKLELKKKGYKIGRIFTIHEVRGLEYENIYCYNIISKFDKIWEMILNNTEKSKNINNIYFNMLYISATRAKKNLFFIEEKETEINRILDKYCNLIEDENIILNGFIEGFTKEMWLKEAQKLESEKRYYQAYEAYIKSEERKKAELCLSAYNRKIQYENINKFTAFIFIKSSKIDKEEIEEILLTIYDRYEIIIKGYITIYRYDILIRNLYSVEKYINNDKDISELAQIIASEITSNEFSKKQLYIKCCFYKNEEPVDIKLLLGKNYEDIRIIYDNDNIIVEECNLSYIRNIDKERIEQKKLNKTILGDSFDNELLIEERKAKYENKTADDILKFIFK